MAFSILPTVVSLVDTYKKAEHYDPTRDSLIACAHAVFELGGSGVFPIAAGAVVTTVPEYRDLLLVPTSAQLGFVWRVELEVRTDDAGTTVTPELYNVTDASVAWTGSAANETAWGTVHTSGAITIASGKRYRLRATKNNDAVEAWIKGRIVRTAS